MGLTGEDLPDVADAIRGLPLRLSHPARVE